MSGSPFDEPLTGLILQGDRIVGGMNLPEPPDEFIRDFNETYARSGLRVVLNDLSEPQSHEKGG